MGPNTPRKAIRRSTMALATAALFLRRRSHASCQSERLGTSSWAVSVGAVRSVIANPRIKPCIKKIDDQVESHDEDRNDDNGSHDEVVSAAKRALHEVAADTGDAEDSFDHDRTGEKAGGGRAEIGSGGKHGGAQRMNAHNHTGRQ